MRRIDKAMEMVRAERARLQNVHPHHDIPVTPVVPITANVSTKPRTRRPSVTHAVDKRRVAVLQQPR